MAHNAFHALVRGKVQGVGFRYSAVKEAERLRLKGWVKNTARGSVEVWAEGPKDKLDLFRKWLRHGPSYSRVDSLEAEETEPRGYTEFNVEY